MTIDPRIPVSDGTHIGALWTANLLGPVTVLLIQELSYILSEKAGCAHGQMWTVHLSFALGLALTLLAGSLGWREWRRWGAQPSTPEGDPGGRSRFMSVVGMLVSTLSAVVVIAMWSATLFLHPCQ
jgi:hypothetical protein